MADFYQLKVLDLKSRNNSKSIALPRQIAMFLCKLLTSASLPEIGKSFGGKHHSTVIHSIRKIEDLRRRDEDFNTLTNNFIESFRWKTVFPQLTRLGLRMFCGRVRVDFSTEKVTETSLPKWQNTHSVSD